jgi:alpha-D-ribose 1-methylphosphonate 5-triphosphate diphosphatase PhnM
MTVSALKTEATANKPEVIAMVKDTQQRRKKRKAVVLEEEGAAAADDARQAYLNNILELPVMVAEFPSLLELAKQSMMGTD